MNTPGRATFLRASTLCAAVLVVLGAHHEASAQSTDPQFVKARKTNLLLLVDTSERMRDAVNGGPANCQTGEKGKYTALAEVLTGSIDDLRCTNNTPLDSNGCRPFINGHAQVQDALAANPGSWPVRTSGNPEVRDMVTFCGKHGNYANRCGTYGDWNSGSACKVHHNEWDQAEDGLIDTFARSMRFGLMTFDPVASIDTHTLSAFHPVTGDVVWFQPINKVLGDPYYGGPDNCQMRTDGGHCRISAPFGLGITDQCGCNCVAGTCTWTSAGGGCNNFDNDLNCAFDNCVGDLCIGLFCASNCGGSGLDYVDPTPQYSYWFASGADNWTTPGGRTAYGGTIHTRGAFSGNIYTSDEAHIDIGARNPLARPDEGRMIGFGPPDWVLTNPGLTGCSSEDECTALHSEMVEQTILATANTLSGGTPLAAQLRDAYEFMLHDNVTQGVHLPHKHDQNPNVPALKGLLGPQNDGAVLDDGCREQAVLLLTEGVPRGDISERPAHWATQMRIQGQIKTFVVGLSSPTAQWFNGTTLVTEDCSELDADTAFDSGNMCEPEAVGSLLFRRAEDAQDNPALGEADKIRACCTLLEVAKAGGTVRPYFPADQSELKQDINKVFSAANGSVLSRTVPVFAPAPTIFLQNGGDPLAPSVYYELRSSVNVTPDDTIWRGHLERIRYSCTNSGSTSTPTINDMDPLRGDDFEANINVQSPTRARRYFSVLPLDSGDINTLKLEGTLRSPGTASPNAQDNLFAGGTIGDFRRLPDNASTSPDQLRTLNDFVNDLDDMTGTGDLEDVMGIDYPDDRNACRGTTDTHASEDDCAEYMMKWYGGAYNPGGNRTPSRNPDNSSRCPNESCSAMGGIYKSSPVVVPPPETFDSDEQNFAHTRSTPATPSFHELYKNRPTMVYQQTTDGQLHAFVLNVNDNDNLPPDFQPGAPAPDVNTSNTLQNNELWTFVVPAAIPSIFPNFNSQVRLTDGPLTWANVVYQRPYNTSLGVVSTDQTNWSFNTVLVGSSGTSALGGFYYALDVTNPTAPKFLWQISYAGNDEFQSGDPGDRLFGASAPGAAITHIRYREQNGALKVIAVAVLPGGDSYQDKPLTTSDRNVDPATYWQSSDGRRPRRRIRDWDTPAGDASRSLTFVELSTGRILARLVGDPQDNPKLPGTTTPTLLNSYVRPFDSTNKLTPFDSPITGIPVAYPSGVGDIAERIYVGDADGTMWRVELLEPNPATWKARISFDAYNTGSSTQSTMRDAWVAAGAGANNDLGDSSTDEQASTKGQPIQAAPVLALDENGDLTITFATGDQETFGAISDGMINMLVSYADQFDVANSRWRTVIGADTGVELAWKNGGRVTGPLNLFDGQLYFAYFVPDNGTECLPGTGGMCGVVYNRRNSFEPLGNVDLSGDGNPDVCDDFDDNEVVFGVSINLVPSCNNTPQNFTDSWLGGSYQTVTSSTQGQYQLSFHTGQAGEGRNDAKTPSDAVNLPIPKAKTRVRTWVSVVE